MDDTKAQEPVQVTTKSRGRAGSRSAPMEVQLQLGADPVRRIMDQSTNRRIERNAITLVRYYAEDDIRRLVEKADVCAMVRNSKTIQARDVTAARDLL